MKQPQQHFHVKHDYVCEDWYISSYYVYNTVHIIFQ